MPSPSILVDMIDITAADVSAQQDAWAWVVASAALEEAVNGLYSAGVLLDALADAVGWQVAAGHYLRVQILSVRQDVQQSIVTTRDLHGRLEGVMG